MPSLDIQATKDPGLGFAGMAKSHVHSMLYMGTTWCLHGFEVSFRRGAICNLWALKMPVLCLSPCSFPSNPSQNGVCEPQLRDLQSWDPSTRDNRFTNGFAGPLLTTDKLATFMKACQLGRQGLGSRNPGFLHPNPTAPNRLSPKVPSSHGKSPGAIGARVP